MKRALLISIAAHFTILISLWQVSNFLSRPISRGYPRLITARLVAKPGGAPAAAPIKEPAAAESKPAPVAAPKFKPDEKKPESAKAQPQKKPPAVKQPATKPSTTPAPNAGRGSATSKSDVGSGSNALKLDVVDFPFPTYITLVQYRIESNWEPPYSGEGQLLATVYFKITRSGEIENVELEQSSGNIIFDQAAKRAVYNANPLPPLPDDSGLETLGVHFDFVAN